jgi:hypothetical protein
VSSSPVYGAGCGSIVGTPVGASECEGAVANLGGTPVGAYVSVVGE